MRFKGFSFSLFLFSIMLLLVLSFIGSPVLSTASALSSTTSENNNIKTVQFMPPNQMMGPLQQFMPPNQMMDPIQQKFIQLKQNYAILEQQLALADPQQRQFMVSQVQQGILQMLSQAYPQQQNMLIQMLQQAMSPMLAQQILVPILSQGAPMMLQPPQSTNKGTFNIPGPSVEESEESIKKSQKKIDQIDRSIQQWDDIYDQDWKDSFGTFGD
jgi:hypothetical protein